MAKKAKKSYGVFGKEETLVMSDGRLVIISLTLRRAFGKRTRYEWKMVLKNGGEEVDVFVPKSTTSWYPSGTYVFIEKHNLSTAQAAVPDDSTLQKAEKILETIFRMAEKEDLM